MATMTEAEYALRIIKEICIESDHEVYWTAYNRSNKDWNGPIRACINCSDTFHWASADSEQIEPGDIDLLAELIKEDEYNGALLWVCMKRDMAPMPAYMKMLKEPAKNGTLKNYNAPFIFAIEEKFGADDDLDLASS